MSNVSQINVGNNTYDIKDATARSGLANKQDIIQKTALPTASLTEEGNIYQYIGATESGLTNGYFYKCVENSGVYSWVRINVQPSSGGSSVQSDWLQSDTTADDFIKNKPDLTEHLPIIATTKTSTSGGLKVEDNIGIAVDVTWNGLTSFDGSNIWTDGNSIYYSYNSDQYVLDKSTSTWTAKTWSGLTSFRGNYIWTDGTDIYYSAGSNQYVLDKSTSTWNLKTWDYYPSPYGIYIWTDGNDIYYSSNGYQFVLDKSISDWDAKDWNGFTNFDGSCVWTDGTDIYYSSSSDQYVLDKSTSTWTAKTWSGFTNINGPYIWTDGNDIYYSYSSDQYVLDKSTSTWNPKTWTGLTSFRSNYIWTDGTDIYYSYNTQHKKLINRRYTSYTQTSDTITAMTGYSKPESTSAIEATDTLNEAIGKLEKAIESSSGGGSWEYSWALASEETIGEMIAASKAETLSLSDYWAIGDERTVEFGAISTYASSGDYPQQSVNIVLLDDHYIGGTGASASKRYNVYVLGIKNSPYAMPCTYYSSSTSTTAIRTWASCPVKTWLTGSYGWVYALPYNIRQYTVSVRTRTANTYDANDTYMTIPSEYEIYGTNMNANYDEGANGNAQLEYYKTSTNRIMYRGYFTSSYTYYWTRTVTPSYIVNQTQGGTKIYNTSFVFGYGANTSQKGISNTTAGCIVSPIQFLRYKNTDISL